MSNRWKDKDYISLLWDGKPDYYCISGHHDKETVAEVLMAEEDLDVSGYEVHHEYARVTGIGFYLFTTPAKGRIPVSVVYVR